MKKSVSVFLLIVLLFALTGCETTVESDINHYDSYLGEIKHSDQWMPNLEDFDNATTTQVFLTQSSGYWFCESINLVVTYDETVYQGEKAALFENYTLLELDEETDNNGTHKVGETETVIDGFTLHIVEDDSFYYSWYFGLIGYNDDTMQISYTYFYQVEPISFDSLYELLEGFVAFNEERANEINQS